MIVKERYIPLSILILEALLRRLPKSHSKRPQIIEELAKRWSGYHGEVSLDLYFTKLEQKFMIFHDLNLPDRDYNCQIDSLLLSTKFIPIIEVKNMSGKLIFDSVNDQFFQVIDGKEKGYPDPVSQVERHKNYLEKLLADHKFPPVPIEYMIVISNPYAVLEFKGTSPEVRQRICKSHSFLKRFSLLEKKYANEVLNDKNLRKLSRLLLKINYIPINYLLKKYGIKKTNLLPGVHCPHCLFLPMTRLKGKWYCPSCNQFSSDAHVFALEDYFLLFDSTISNEKFRIFACIASPDQAGRLLRSVNLKSTGKNKNRIYFPETIPWRNSVSQIK